MLNVRDENYLTDLIPLGRGGFGQVYKATYNEKYVAVKVLSPAFANDVEANQRFKREAEILARLSHQGLIGSYGLKHTSEGLGLVLELADRSLLDNLKDDGQWPWTRIVETFPVLFEALHLLHLEGVIHRDIKPHNILSVGGKLKLADFGIAHFNPDWDFDGLTVTNFHPGTPMYQSPEQVRGQEDLDGRSDLYSLGVVLYNTLSGTYYLNASRYKNEFELQLGVLQDPPKRLPKELGIPAPLTSLLERLLNKDRDERPSSGLEVSDFLRRFVEKEHFVRQVPLPEIQEKPPANDIEGMLDFLKKSYPQRIASATIQPKREGGWSELDKPLPKAFRAGLARLGIPAFYGHQAAGINAVRKGQDTIIVTGTASGKTLAYNLPILENLSEDRSAKALYLFPLKALANDQFYALQRLNDEVGTDIIAARYDGDTSKQERGKIEVHPPQVLFANPDILHASILKNHPKWARFWRGLRYVVIDEVHTYTGSFGSHVTNVLRRLQAVASQYGATPQFILASATIDSPQQFAKALTGRDFSLIDGDSAPRAERHFVFWEPFGSRSSKSEQWLRDTEELMTLLISRGYSAIAFPSGRQQAERIANRVAIKLEANGYDPNLVTVYRGGLLPKERQALETKLRSGKVKGVISTSALELGVDIGGLDAVILPGFPDTVMSTWQRVGRVGRRGQPALVIFVARPNRFDLYYLEHAESFLERPNEPAIIYPDQPSIFDAHLSAALKEASFKSVADIPPFPKEVATRLTRKPSPTEVYPKPHSISLRSSEERVIIYEGEREVGEASWSQAVRELHPGALYSHAGKIYRVEELLPIRANVKREFTYHYTRPNSENRVNVRQIIRQTSFDGFGLFTGELTVRHLTTGYREFDANDMALKRPPDFEKPLEHHLHTQGAWVTVPDTLRDELDRDLSVTRQPDDPHPSFTAIHAAEHLLGFATVLQARCSPYDVTGYPHASGRHPQVPSLNCFLWDTSPLGLRMSETIFEKPREVVSKAIGLARCDCWRYEGCPRCTVDPSCALFNNYLWREGGLLVLQKLYQALP